MTPICMAEEFWINTQLSMARYYGRVKFNGHEYYIVDKRGRDLWECSVAKDRAGSSKAIPPGEPADLVRKDFIPFYRKLGRERFLVVLKDNPTAPDTKLKSIYKEIIKDGKEKKTDARQLTLDELFKADADEGTSKLKRCRTCKHRMRVELNSCSPRIIQCCELKPSKRSNSGFKTIKVTDVACNMYEEDTK